MKTPLFDLKTLNIVLLTLVGFLSTAIFLNYRSSAVAEGHVRATEKHMADRIVRDPNGAAWLAPDVPLRDMNFDYLLNIETKTLRRVPFRTFTNDGHITKESLDYVGVPLSKMNEIQEIVNSAYRKVEDSIGKRTNLIAEESDEASGVSVYQVSGSIPEGEAIFQDMVGDLQNLIGNKKALELVSGMKLSERYSFFGMNDAKIEISEAGDGVLHPEHAFSVKILQTNPLTGEMVSRTTCVFDFLKMRYGRVFSTATR